MDIIRREDIKKTVCLGRTIWRAVGAEAALDDSISVGFTHFSRKNGIMKAHKHEREIIYVLDSKGATARFGSESDRLKNATVLRPGDLLRFQQDEWHIFDLADETSYLDILWIFSVPKNSTIDAE